MGTSRSGDDGASERHQGVLTTLLNEMDGVQELLGVTILAATNRPDVIVCNLGLLLSLHYVFDTILVV